MNLFCILIWTTMCIAFPDPTKFHEVYWKFHWVFGIVTSFDRFRNLASWGFMIYCLGAICNVFQFLMIAGHKST